LPKYPDPEYYTKEVKNLNKKVRKAHNEKKAGLLNQAELNQLSKVIDSEKEVSGNLPALSNAKRRYLLGGVFLSM
jgi:hypothetical protein